MIKANELRIGNYVYFENPHYDCVKIKISSNDFKNFERNNCFANFDPITLTKEWLLNAGFVKHSPYFTNGSIIEFYENNNALFCELPNDNVLYHIKYVHQLQNLYFALTGAELVFSTEP